MTAVRIYYLIKGNIKSQCGKIEFHDGSFIREVVIDHVYERRGKYTE